MRRGLGYRTFIVSEDQVVWPVSHKALDDLYLGAKATLKAYAGQTIDLVMVFYETRNRKPYRALRFDSLRLKLTKAGAVDREHRDEALRFAAEALGGVLDEKPKPVSGNVIDASGVFMKRQREARHFPKISLAATRGILERLGL